MTMKGRYKNAWSRCEQQVMSPKEIVRAWIEAFNRADAETLGRLYAPNAINHQVAERAIEGRAAIQQNFEAEFARARMI
jgi:ketosteroid isomerase-like protein